MFLIFKIIIRGECYLSNLQNKRYNEKGKSRNQNEVYAQEVIMEDMMNKLKSSRIERITA